MYIASRLVTVWRLVVCLRGCSGVGGYCSGGVSVGGLGFWFVVGPGSQVGPFAFEGLVVSFYFAVLLAMIRLDRDMADTVPGEQVCEHVVACVSPVVVGHDLGDVGVSLSAEVVESAGGELCDVF